LFLLFDRVTKVLKVSAVLKAAAQLGFSVGQIVEIGILLLVCTIIYVFRGLRSLGAILLTGYVGGATVTNLRADNPFRKGSGGFAPASASEPDARAVSAC
jgi:hypothetical protein